MIAARRNHDIRYSTYLDGMVERHMRAKNAWAEHCEAMRVERQKAFYLLKRVLGESFEGFIVPSIQLSKPTYPKPQRDTAPKVVGITKMMLNGAATVGEVFGQAINQNKTTKESYWQMPPETEPNNPVRVTVPRILAMDVENCRKPHSLSKVVGAARRKNSKPYLPAIATLYP